MGSDYAYKHVKHNSSLYLSVGHSSLDTERCLAGQTVLPDTKKWLTYRTKDKLPIMFIDYKKVNRSF